MSRGSAPSIGVVSRYSALVYKQAEQSFSSRTLARVLLHWEKRSAREAAEARRVERGVGGRAGWLASTAAAGAAVVGGLLLQDADAHADLDVRGPDASHTHEQDDTLATDGQHTIKSNAREVMAAA